jgi:hypothetical protein
VIRIHREEDALLRDIRNWLSPPLATTLLDDLRKKRQKGSGEWLFSLDRMRALFEKGTEENIMILTGTREWGCVRSLTLINWLAAGCGKTMLSYANSFCKEFSLANALGTEPH